MSVETPPKKPSGRRIEHPDSPIHKYWRERSRRYYWKKKGEKTQEEGKR